MFVDQIAEAIAAARGPSGLDHLSKAIWQGLAAGALGDDDAQRLAEMIHARRMADKATAAGTGSHPARKGIYPPRKPQRPPVRAVAIERRRRLASSGPLPPSLACRFTTSELSVLRIVGDECHARGFCTLPIDAIAARAGTSRTTVQNALRQAVREGLVDVQERRQHGAKNLPNKITVVCKEWRAWLARGPKRTGFKNLNTTDTSLSERRKIGIPPSTSESNSRPGTTLDNLQKGFRQSRGG